MACGIKSFYVNLIQKAGDLAYQEVLALRL